jgi:DNA-binding MarR family transcriptional regulator
MADPVRKLIDLEKKMFIMRKFFAEYFRRTTSSILHDEPDFSFLELKGLSAFIDDQREYTISEISTTIHLPLSNITIIINRLAKKGIVKKKRDLKDKRVIRVFLTEKGKKMRREFMGKRVQEVKDLLGRLSEEDQNDLFNAFETATNIFQKIQYS